MSHTSVERTFLNTYHVDPPSHVCDTVLTVLVVTRGPWIWVDVIMVKDTQTRIV